MIHNRILNKNGSHSGCHMSKFWHGICQVHGLGYWWAVWVLIPWSLPILCCWMSKSKFFMILRIKNWGLQIFFSFGFFNWMMGSDFIVTWIRGVFKLLGGGGRVRQLQILCAQNFCYLLIAVWPSRSRWSWVPPRHRSWVTWPPRHRSALVWCR